MRTQGQRLWVKAPILPAGLQTRHLHWRSPAHWHPSSYYHLPGTVRLHLQDQIRHSLAPTERTPIGKNISKHHLISCTIFFRCVDVALTNIVVQSTGQSDAETKCGVPTVQEQMVQNFLLARTPSIYGPWWIGQLCIHKKRSWQIPSNLCFWLFTVLYAH